MFPWSWNFIWAPHWPASGDVEQNGWTNSLFSIREITTVEKFVQAYKLQKAYLHAKPTATWAEVKPTLPSITNDDLLIAENLLERMKTR